MYPYSKITYGEDNELASKNKTRLYPTKRNDQHG
jgi:hypothetical protein